MNKNKNINKMRQDINKILKENDFLEIEITNEETIKKIYELYINGKEYLQSQVNTSEQNNLNSDEELLYGIYYDIKKNKKKMKEYYTKSIQKGNCHAMFNLGDYYNEKKKYDKMKKYYMMAIDKDNSYAMTSMGKYYEDKKDYEKMEKYYLMAIDKNNSTAMNNLALYYEDKGEYEIMKKYYEMAIERGCQVSMYNLGLFYKKKREYEKMKKYLKMAIEKKDKDAMHSLGIYYEKNKEYEKMKKYYEMAKKNKNYDSIYRLGRYYELDKKYEKMKENYDIVVSSEKLRIIKLICYNRENMMENDKIKKNIIDDIRNLKLEYAIKGYNIEKKIARSFVELQAQARNAQKKNNKIFEKIINAMVDDKNINELIRYKDYLNKKNRNKLTDNIKKYVRAKNSNIERIIEKKECNICYEIKEIAKLYCGHEICIDCHDKTIKCPYCRESYKESCVNFYDEMI